MATNATMTTSQNELNEDTEPKYCMSIHEYYRVISIAFQGDVENFLTEFEKKASLKFKDFSEVWRNLKFSYVFSEQRYYTFIQNFMDNAFFVLKKFIMFPKNIYTEVGTLYLIYAMYFKQTVHEWVKIRITYEERLKIQQLLNRLKEQQELEPLFIYDKLLKANAFQYVFQRKIIAPELRYLKNSSEFVDDTFQTINVRNSCKQLKDLLNEGDFMNNFIKASSSYQQALSQSSAKYPGLGAMSSTLVDDLKSLLENNSSPSSDPE